MADSGPSPRYVRGYELMFEDAFLQTPFHKVCSTGRTRCGQEMCAAATPRKSVIKF